MGLLDGLSAGLTAATNAASAQQEGELHGSQLMRAIMMQQLDQQAKRSTIDMNAARARNFDSEVAARANPHQNWTVQVTDKGLVRVNPMTGETQPLQMGGQPVAPPPKPQGHVVDPVTGEVKFFDPTHPPAGLRVNPKPEKDPAPQLVTSVGPDGKPVYGAFDKGSRTIRRVDASDLSPKGAGAGGLSGPIAAKVGQFGEMLKKTHDLLNAQEALEVGLGNSAAQDVAAHGVGIGHMRVPGTQGVGSLLVNRTPEYATYQAALEPLILAAAHAMSGARINNEQAQMIRQSIEIKPGESKQSRAQKLKNLMDMTNSIGGALPPDAVATQEAQMDPAQIAKLQAHGYRAGRHGAPSGGQSSHVTPTERAQLKAQGFTDAQIDAITP